MTEYLDLKNAPEVKRVVLAAFPDYRKHKASIGPFHPTSINSYWDGGSRDEHAIVELATLRKVDLPSSSHPYFDVARAGLANQENEAVSVDRVGNVTLKALPEGYALVTAGTFCGKPATARVLVNASNLTPFLKSW